MLTVADIPPWFVRTLAFLFGAVWGSFFNVAIYRWPRDMSVVSPPSHCPSCGQRVPSYRNIPIFAYLFMRGRAPCCGSPLTPRYLVVEALGALFAVTVAERWILARPLADPAMASLAAVAVFFFLGGLLVASLVDLEWMEIPDEVSLPGAALGLATVAIRPEVSAADAALGAGAAYLGVQIIFVWGYERATGRRGMGEGDSKLLLFIGAFLGWQGAAFALVAGSAQGLLGSGALAAIGQGFETKEPENAYGNLELDGGRIFIDVARAHLGRERPQQLLLEEGIIDVTLNSNATRPVRIVTAAATCIPAAGTHAQITTSRDGTLEVEVERGVLELRRARGDLREVHRVVAGHALRWGLGDTEGPVPAEELNSQEPGVPDFAAIDNAAADLLEVCGGVLASSPGETPLPVDLDERLLLALERLQVLQRLQRVPADADATLHRARELLGTAPDDLPATDPTVRERPAFLARKLPFGPFLSLGAVEYLLFGDHVLAWYSSLFP